MPTGTISLPIESAVQGDGSSGNEFPAVSILTSTDADNPKARRWTAAFDDTTAETVSLGFRLPANYASGGMLKLNYYMASATTGGIAFRAALQAVTPGDSTDVKALDPVNAGGGWATGTDTVAGTAGYVKSVSITLNMNSAAAGDSVVMFLQRNPADAGDTATGDAIILDEVQIEYTTS